ncbi:MAG: carbamoyltransferase HypF [Methylobacter sp.]|uniref:carbamoyltransferase HypF n=1 Tax=Methylobacter sp. TaxID=2051955 RepID=UPI0027302DC4|nr:carbamoyltransferase HypF [Methylobacter sp.]MDP1664596.1 carbamoyltransferase HypF [Methylobacter sp.]
MTKGFNINKEHLKITIKGFVQGLGFRPFIVRLARQHQQKGWIANTNSGVTIDIEGLPEHQQDFIDGLNNQLPPFAKIDSLTIIQLPQADFDDFRIKASTADGTQSAFVLPDIATCPDCISDISDPTSRYYHYPFTSCCHCGPRYSIMTRQPYDRSRTGMAAFTICRDCGQDYQAIDNRRFHAQTIACPNCGPGLSLLDESGNLLAEKHDALRAAIGQLRAGKIVAVKGIGGYQLLADATNQQAVERLRLRKHRPQKPFALMVANLATAQQLCMIGALEQQALSSAAAPIVLLNHRDSGEELINPEANKFAPASAVAPGSNLLGIMLPYSPLHHLLLNKDIVAKPLYMLVATSGNRQNEPICITERQALTRLAGIADYFLTHNRPILRPLDDSVVRFINGKITVLRRARGYTPLPITLKTAIPDTLAVGGQLKNTIAISHGPHIILSQHLGDLDSEATQQQFQSTLTDLQDFYQTAPTRIMHDLHSGYVSSRFAANSGTQTGPVQHHYAHTLSCMAEHGLEPPALGISWDGSGLGTDNTLWGGEFLLINRQGFERYAHFAPFSLPGGHKAIQEPRRAALGLLYEIVADDCMDAGGRASQGAAAEVESRLEQRSRAMHGAIADSVFDRKDLPFSAQELKLLQSALTRQLNCPRTTSVGRLFDAVASLLGLCHINHYEGQAAMALEMSAASSASGQHYDFHLKHETVIVIDWKITLKQLLDDIPHNPVELIACKFHNTLAEIILAIARRAGQKTVILSGGCFQNAYLTTNAAKRLKSSGFEVYCNEKIPPNDGGLALGQLYAAKYIG